MVFSDFIFLGRHSLLLESVVPYEKYVGPKNETHLTS